MSSQWRKYIAQPGHIRAVAIEGTALTRELCRQQGLSGPAQLGYAEAVIGAMLIASGHKSNESINMNAQGSGIYKQALIDASPEGRARGFFREQTDKGLHSAGPQGYGPWGSGLLSVLYTKNFEGKHPYTGMVPISTGFLDEAINDFYRDSEQLVSLAGLAVVLDEGGIVHARGALIQALGGASLEELQDIRSIGIQPMRDLAALADQPGAFEARLQQLLKGRGFGTVETQELSAFCTCSQERIERALLLTGEEDTLEALAGDPVMTVTCDFCRTEYKLSAERVKALFKRDPSRLQ